MKTIHIFNIKTNRAKELMQAFYKHYLKDDSEFFYAIEPDLIIRCGSKAQKGIIKYLKVARYRYDIYNYPKAPKNWMHDDKNEKLLDIILPIHHLFAVASLTLPCKKFHHIRERVFHLANNMHFLDEFEEAEVYTNYANFRLQMGMIKRK